MLFIQLGVLLLSWREPGWKGLKYTASQVSWLAFIKKVLSGSHRKPRAAGNRLQAV